MKTDIVIPVHNAPTYILRLLDILDETASRERIILVDDASLPETAHILTEYHQTHPNSVLLKNECQQLFTRSVNKGIRASTTDRIACLCSDVFLRPGWLEKLQTVMDSDEKIGIVGYPDKSEDNEDTLVEKKEPDYVTGHTILLRRKMLEEIGTFCETDREQAHINSDRILGYRANRAGWRTIEVRCPLCTHEAGKSWGHNLYWLFNDFNYAQLTPGNDKL